MITEQKLKEIRETFEKTEKLLENGDLPEFEGEHIGSVHDVLGWVLGEYSRNPLEDY
jgi:hypothetical protein